MLLDKNSKGIIEMQGLMSEMGALMMDIHT